VKKLSKKQVAKKAKKTKKGKKSKWFWHLHYSNFVLPEILLLKEHY
jgi:hypothetical protein